MILHCRGSAGSSISTPFVQRERLGHRLSRDFGYLKSGKQVVYPMHTQMRLLIDAAVVGARRVFDFEWLATDPVFEHLAGGAVPSIDTLYDHLRRFGPEELESLEALVAEQGLRLLRDRRLSRITVDIDTTVMPLFGHQEGAVPGSNPRYHGRPSHHPILARIAETDTVFGARLRPGDTALGETDVEDVEHWLDRAREAAGPKALITVRIDAGGDCAALRGAIHGRKAFFVVKAKQTPNLLGAAMQVNHWHTVDIDADGKPSRRAAQIDFQREDWPSGCYRVIAIRTNERDSGRQVRSTRESSRSRQQNPKPRPLQWGAPQTTPVSTPQSGASPNPFASTPIRFRTVVPRRWCGCSPSSISPFFVRRPPARPTSATGNGSRL
jgi:hypothetical protein